jgi:hypothetical protein
MEKSIQKRNTNGIQLLTTSLIALGFMFFLVSCNNDDNAMEFWEPEVGLLKMAVEPLKDFGAAQTAGYDIPATEYRTQMGYHFLNGALLDDKFEIEKPEVLIFVNDPAGKMQLVAVEYGIPIQDLDNPPPPPEGYTGSDDVWKVDTEFMLWTLHVWVVMENPEGIFTPMNPMLP